MAVVEGSNAEAKAREGFMQGRQLFVLLRSQMKNQGVSVGVLDLEVIGDLG